MKTKAECLQILRDYMQKNAQRYGIVRMGIFGSVARGDNTEDSDVDVVIEGNLKGFFALAGIKTELEELFGCSVDVVRLRDKMDALFKSRILNEGIYA